MFKKKLLLYSYYFRNYFKYYSMVFVKRWSLIFGKIEKQEKGGYTKITNDMCDLGES